MSNLYIRTVLGWLGACAVVFGAATPGRAQAVLETHIKVQIQGAVRHPGIYSLLNGSRVAELVAKAGGPRPDADIRELNLTHVLADGEACRISSKAETAAAPIQLASASHATKGHGSRKPRSTSRARSAKGSKGAKLRVGKGGGGQIHLNRAGAEELQQLPGIGPGLADAILEQRKRQGRFRTLDDLREISGFGQRRLDRLKPYVVVD